jgi:DinB superfamily
MSKIAVFVMALAAMAGICAAEDAGKMFDRQLAGVERELVPLVEAMPADRMNFAPTAGAFTGVRTFRDQAMHIGAVMYLVSAGILAEKPPAVAGINESGPAEITSKAEIVKYLNGAFAYAHRAMNSLTAQNLTDMVKSPFGEGQTLRGALAITNVSHVMDHYGQMVVYARMNSIIPPASR